VSMVWLVSGALWSLLEMLGDDQPRDAHVHGAPHARAEPSAQPMQYERGVCARRTATKYRNTTTATRYPAGSGAALACSVAKMVAVAGSSGRRGRRFRCCRPDQTGKTAFPWICYFLASMTLVSSFNRSATRWRDPDGESAAPRRSFRSTTYVRGCIGPNGPSPVINTV